MREELMSKQEFRSFVVGWFKTRTMKAETEMDIAAILREYMDIQECLPMLDGDVRFSIDDQGHIWL